MGPTRPENTPQTGRVENSQHPLFPFLEGGVPRLGRHQGRIQGAARESLASGMPRECSHSEGGQVSVSHGPGAPRGGQAGHRGQGGAPLWLSRRGSSWFGLSGGTPLATACFFDLAQSLHDANK